MRTELCGGCLVKFKKNALSTHLLSLRVSDARCDIYVPESIDDVVVFTARHQQFLVLAGGTNVIFGHVTTPVLYMGRPLGDSETRDVPDDDEYVIVQMPAGVSISSLLNYCIANGLSGLEFMAGIPGTVGGALHGNAAPKGYSWEDHAVMLIVVSGGKLYRFAPRFAYRKLLNKPTDPFVIVAAELLLKKGSSDMVRAGILHHLSRRIKINRPSAGSLFRNPEGERSVGLLADTLGLKGFRIGDAGLSDSHANIVVNYGNATANDFCTLRDSVQEKIKHSFNITVEPEVAFWEEQ